MILLNDFFKILSVGKTENKFIVAVEINPAHEIFIGHFPGQPVVPGVCMVQMLKDTLAHIYKKEFTMKSASQLKFLAILNPKEVKLLNIEISVLREDPEELYVSGIFQREGLVFLKYKAVFTAFA